MANFQPGETLWIDRLGNLRNVVRQEMITRQLGDHVVPGMSVLDVGCGQGTQLLRLADLGCAVTGVEPSPTLREMCMADAQEGGLNIELAHGTIEDLEAVIGPRTFDLVCAHGLLMYLPDRSAALKRLAAHVAPGGFLSFTFRNGHALSMRHGLRRDWSAALAAFDNRLYTNELGVDATADRLEDVQHDLANLGYRVVDWYGVRVFNDAVSVEMQMPDSEDVAVMLDAEEQAGRRDPYRWLGSMLHVIATRID
jgi:S-adenosylmethionine-dependent methyltransferase